MTLTVELPRLRTLQFLTEQTLPDEPVSARVVVSGTNEVLEISEFQLALGPSRVSGRATFRPAPEPTGVSVIVAALHAEYLDLQGFQGPPEPAGTETPAPRTRDRIIPDTSLPPAALPNINATFDLSAKRIVVRAGNLDDVVLRGDLSDGALRIERFDVTSGRGSLGGKAHLRPSEDGLTLALDVKGENLIFGLPAANDEARRLLPTDSVRAQLTASGATVRELASSLNGYVRIVIGEGRLAVSELGFLMRDFARQVLDAVNPFAQTEELSRIQCIAGLVEVNDGVVFGRPAIVFQSDKLNVTSIAKVDLTTEHVVVKFHTQARRGLGISLSDLVSPYTEIGGTLANPHLQLNAGGALLQGSAAVATGGLSFLAKKAQERLFSDRDPCSTAIGEADADLVARGVIEPTP